MRGTYNYVGSLGDPSGIQAQRPGEDHEAPKRVALWPNGGVKTKPCPDRALRPVANVGGRFRFRLIC